MTLNRTMPLTTHSTLLIKCHSFPNLGTCFQEAIYSTYFLKSTLKWCYLYTHLDPLCHSLWKAIFIFPSCLCRSGIMNSRDSRNPETKFWFCTVSVIFELFLEHAALNPFSSALKWEKTVAEETHSFSVFILSFLSHENSNIQLIYTIT